MNITIIYEDNHLLVVEKPVNMPVQEDQSRDQDLLTVLKQDIKIRYNKPGNVYLALVHRLDRPVGGAIVFAKTSKAASRLSELLRKRELERQYLTVVRGRLRQRSGTLKHYLVKNNKKNEVHSVEKKDKGAKEAILHYEVVGDTENNLTLLRIKLETGRSHQIRVQLAHSGHPIYGDQKYGQSVNKPGQQIALWSQYLQFKHTTKDEMITVQSQPPQEFPWNLWELKKL